MVVEIMNGARKVEICKSMGGRRFNGEGGRKKASKERKCNEDAELERCGGWILKGESRERRRKCSIT